MNAKTMLPYMGETVLKATQAFRVWYERYMNGILV